MPGTPCISLPLYSTQTLVKQWEDEVKKFAPHLCVRTLYNGAGRQEALRDLYIADVMCAATAAQTPPHNSPFNPANPAMSYPNATSPSFNFSPMLPTSPASRSYSTLFILRHALAESRLLTPLGRLSSWARAGAYIDSCWMRRTC